MTQIHNTTLTPHQNTRADVYKLQQRCTQDTTRATTTWGITELQSAGGNDKKFHSAEKWSAFIIYVTSAQKQHTNAHKFWTKTFGLRHIIRQIL